MKTLNLVVGVGALIISTSGLVFSIAAANNPLSGTPCLLTTDACNAFAREAAWQDFVDGFVIYSVFTTFSSIVLFLGRTKPEQVIYDIVQRHREEYLIPENPQAPDGRIRFSAQKLGPLKMTKAKAF